MDKKNHGGKREGAGRKSGKNKTKIFGGYKYTEEEYAEIKNALDDYVRENNCTKSRALYELITT